MADERPPTGAVGPTGSIDWSAVRNQIAGRRRDADDDALDSAWADALLRRRAEELAQASATPEDEAPTIPLLVGRGADGLYGLPLRHLARIVPLPRVARVPGSSPDLLGLIAIDGRVMRLYDVDRLCGRNAVPAGGGFAVILRGGARPGALRLRTVETVMEMEPDQPTAPPEAGPFVTTITKGRIAVLDVPAILDTLRSAKEE